MSQQLEQALGYRFKNPALLRLALTHRSMDEANNERLEFLGDGVVNLLMAEALFQQFPEAQEGELSRFRATLINRDALGDLARQFEVGKHLILGPGEVKSGGAARPSILSCAMEAIIGAIYLDGGFAAVQECVMRWYQPWLHSLTNAATHKDPKTSLQEWLQSQHWPLPVYTVEAISGESHQQEFQVSCQIAGRAEKTVGTGTSRRRAEQQAAELMLGLLKS